MGNVVLYIATSVDGYIARKDDSVEWLNRYLGQGEDYGYPEFLASVGAIIMGAASYRKMFDFGWGEYANIPTYVLSRNELPMIEGGEKSVHFYSAPAADLVRDLKSRIDGVIWLFGGGEVVRSFLRENLVEELRIFVNPYLLGGGISLLEDIGREIDLTLVASRSFTTGLVEMHYRVNG